MSIIPINMEMHLGELTEVIRESFLTVAAEFNITRDNAPTNPAFIDAKEILKSVSEKKIDYFGYFRRNRFIGCYALENPGKGVYYLERLAVLPEDRHQGIGQRLVLHCFKQVKNDGGRIVSIAIIEENKVLKNWYKRLGFRETEIKGFPHLPFRVCFLGYEL